MMQQACGQERKPSTERRTKGGACREKGTTTLLISYGKKEGCPAHAHPVTEGPAQVLEVRV